MDSCNNNNSNNDKSELFFKVFRNIYLKDLILSFVKRPLKCGFDYNSTTSLKKMLENNKFEMIQDKLKSNHYIDIDVSLIDIYQELSEKSSSSSNNYQRTNKLESILTPLLNKYNNKIQSLSPLESSIQYKSLDSFIYYLNHFKINPITNHNNNNIISNNNNLNINQSYILYHLFEESLCHNSIQISKLILELIKNSSNIYGSGSSNKNEDEVEIGDDGNIQTEGQDSFIINKVMKFNPNDFERYFYILINDLDKEKYEFIRDELKLDLELLIVKNKQDPRKRKNKEALINSSLVYPYIDYLLLLNGYKVNFYYSALFDNLDDDINYAKTKLLKTINRDSSFNPLYRKINEYLKNNPDIMKLKLLISGVREIIVEHYSSMDIVNEITFEDFLLDLFGSFLIFNYLKKKEYDKILHLFNLLGYHKKNLIIETVKNYSISRLSISTFKLMKQLLTNSGDIDSSESLIIRFSNGIVNNEKAEKYINYLMDELNNNISNEVTETQLYEEDLLIRKVKDNSFEINFISKLIDKLINEYDYEFIQAIYNQNENFKIFYNMMVINSESYLNIDRELHKRKISIASYGISDGEFNTFELSITSEEINEAFKRLTISSNYDELITLKYSISDIINQDNEKDIVYEENEVDENEAKYEHYENEGFIDNNIKTLYKLLKNRRYKQALENVSSSLNSTNFEFRSVIKITDFFNNTISLEWFDKLFKSIIKPILDYTSYFSRFDLIVDLTSNRVDIFEYLWENWITDNQFKKDLIYFLLSNIRDFPNSSQLLEYIIKKKSDFIKDQFNLLSKEEYLSCKDLKQVLIYEECYKDILISGNLELFKLFESNFPSFKFKVDSIIFQLFISNNNPILNQFKVLEFLYQNGNIVNLIDIVNQTTQFYRLNYFNKKNYSDHYIFISSSLLILLKQLLNKSLSN